MLPPYPQEFNPTVIDASLLGVVSGGAVAGEGYDVAEPASARLADEPVPPPATAVVREVGGE